MLVSLSDGHPRSWSVGWGLPSDIATGIEHRQPTVASLHLRRLRHRRIGSALRWGRLVPQEPIEMILLKHWASYVETPIWIADDAGNLIFYNRPAEPIVGRRFDEAGEISVDQLAEVFVATAPDGTPLSSEETPLGVALARRIPCHASLRISALDGSSRLIEVTALPIIGQGDRHLGAMATFWEP